MLIPIEFIFIALLSVTFTSCLLLSLCMSIVIVDMPHIHCKDLNMPVCLLTRWHYIFITSIHPVVVPCVP